MVAYFVNGLINDQPTVIETGMYTRVKTFATLGIPAYLVAMQHSVMWVSAIQAAGLTPANVINVFDRLQGVGERPVHPLAVADYHGLDQYTREWHKDRYYYRQGDKVVAVLRPTDEGTVATVTHYDHGVLVRRDIYDERGFLSAVQHRQDKVLHSVDYLTPAGEVAVTQTQQASDTATTILATGETYPTLAAFTTAQLAALAQPGDLFISERREYDAAVAALPAGVTRAYRLYNAPLTITPDSNDVVLARQFLPDQPTAVVFDEYSPSAQLLRGWQRLLTKLGLLPQEVS